MIHNGQVIPGSGVIAFSGFRKPFKGSLIIFLNALSVFIHITDVDVSADAFLSGSLQIAEQVVLEAFPKQEMLARLNTRLEGGDAHPLEAIITRMLLTKVKLEPEDEDVDEPTPENHEEKNDEGEKPQSITSIIKISLTVLVIGYALGKIAMLFS